MIQNLLKRKSREEDIEQGQAAADACSQSHKPDLGAVSRDDPTVLGR